MDPYKDILSQDTTHFFQNYIKSSKEGNLSAECRLNLRQLLMSEPYPTVQILKAIHSHDQSDVEDILCQTLAAFLDDLNTTNTSRFASFLANLPLGILYSSAVKPRLLDPVTLLLFNDECYLALLSHNDTILNEILEQLQTVWQDCNRSSLKEFILYQTLHNKLHFAPLLSCQWKEAFHVKDIVVRNNLIISQLVDTLSNNTACFDNISSNLDTCLAAFDIHALPSEWQSIHGIFHTDFMRQALLIDFLRKHNPVENLINVNEIIQTSSLLQLLHKHCIDVSFEETRNALNALNQLEVKLNMQQDLHLLELDVLIHYTCLVNVFDLLIIPALDQNRAEYLCSKMQQLNVLLRQMHNMVILCDMLEDIFQLVFLRWEHLKLNFIKSKQQRKTKFSSDNNSSEAETTKFTAARTQNQQNAFICCGDVLNALFSMLKSFLAKKVHTEFYKQSSEPVQKRFQRILHVVNETLWKYAVVIKIEDSIDFRGKFQQNSLQPEELLHLVQQHKVCKEKSSSDDEGRDQRCLNRRKSTWKKRRCATFSGTLTNKQKVFGKGMTNSVIETINVDTDPVASLKARNMLARYSDRGIIPKMLASPEDLAAITLSLKNFADVKFIIKTFKLENTNLCRELNFVEQQQQTQQKLYTICNNYQQQQQQQNKFLNKNSMPQTMDSVEQIKIIAALGFEMSKIVNIIGNFAQAYGIQQKSEIKHLLAKQTNNAPYVELLQQLHAVNLGIVPIIDLILNLPLNDEMFANVMSIIRKQHDTFASCALGIGPFAENLYACMRCMPDNTLTDLLSDNYYSLRPARLELEMQREQIFNELFQQTLTQMARSSDLRVSATLFQSLATRTNYHTRLVLYIRHLEDLLQLRDKNVQYHSDELLKINVCQLIGELIFEKQIEPLEIEGVVSALNLNLVHVIAINICPAVVCNLRPSAQVVRKLQQESLLTYIRNQNALLTSLLLGICGISQQNDELNALKRLLNLNEIVKYAVLFGENRYIAALRSDKLTYELISELPDKEKQLEILLLQIGNSDDKIRQMRVIDQTVVALINEHSRNIHLTAHMHNIALRAELIQTHFTRIASTHLAKELIEHTLHHRDLQQKVPTELYENLKRVLADITIYAAVSEVLTFDSWPQAYNFGLKSPQAIFEKLLQMHHYELCYKWCQVVQLSTQFAQFTRTLLNMLLQTLLQLPDEDDTLNTTASEAQKYLLLILETFPIRARLRLLEEHKENFLSLRLLQYVFNFLTENSKQLYTNHKVSLLILEQLLLIDRDALLHLIRYPLLIIELLIMNAKFELLGKVLIAVREFLNKQQQISERICQYCVDQQGHIYDTQPKSLQAHAHNSAFILLNFNLYQQDHIITHACIDLLLRIYATKALDYNISDAAGSERVSMTTDTQFSLHSLSGTFQLPSKAPVRTEWVRDEEATHCMCCRHAAFTMLLRRHHCRRCGRVVCYSCSTSRMLIPELYEQVEVRICDDCQRMVAQQCEESCEAMQISDADVNRSDWSSTKQIFKWQLSGNITHDKLLREEFCYEHAPSVALCLSILNYHLEQKKCVELLLYHCQQLEKLIVPNPEVDYGLVAKMMNCLAVAAKVRGGPAELEHIREHSEIIMSVVQHGCEALIPINNHSLRKLADSLVQAEKWSLALEVHLKCGFPTAGVMAAHGLSCLRAGCFDTAREKLSHCMTKVSDEQTNAKILSIVLHGEPAMGLKEYNMHTVKRPQRGPALLLEILKIIESFCFVIPQPETLKRACVIRNTNSSLASLLTRRREVYTMPLHEPAINVLTSLENLKRISKGDYSIYANQQKNAQLQPAQKAQQRRLSHGYDECLHYVLTYGSHADVLQFFMRNDDLNAALLYYLVQQLDADLFVQYIFVVILRCGKVPQLIEQIKALDNTCSLWRHTLLHTCRYLETKGLLHSLYQLQILLKDAVRASMTCVKFYSMHCENFQQLLANVIHLQNARVHLLEELEVTKWDMRLDNAFQNLPNSAASSRRSSTVSMTSSFPMQLDARALNNHINTISKQLEVTKFLSKAEQENSSKDGLITILTLKQMRIETITVRLPTLFDGPREKIEICILILYCGKNVEEGFGLAYSIIQDYKLPALKVFGATAKYLARNKRLSEVDKLVCCVTSNNGISTRDIDEILSIAINSTVNVNEPEVKLALENLRKKINSIELRISSYIYLGQLKSAYLLANKYERTADIRRILRQAELNNQPHIKKLCLKKLESAQDQAVPEK